MTTIYGTVGYSFFKSNDLVSKYILVLSDIHSKLEYCDNFIQISDWLYENMNDINILLEEVSRDNFKLGELWSSSDHTIKLKDLYLNNKDNIYAIDIRPYLIPFSWELLENDKTLEKIKLKEYISLLNDFLYLKLYKIQEKIPNIYNSNFLNKHKLKKHLYLIRNSYDDFIKKNIDLMDHDIYDIYENNKIIFLDLNLILDSCMEWYIIAKIYDLNNKNNKNFLLHTGLFHSERINHILQTIHDYKLLSEEGINNITTAEKENYDGCTLIPKIILESLTNN